MEKKRSTENPGKFVENCGRSSETLGKCRRARAAYTYDQVRYLESKFKTSRYISVTERMQIAIKLGITQEQYKKMHPGQEMNEVPEASQNTDLEGNQVASPQGKNQSLEQHPMMPFTNFTTPFFFPSTPMFNSQLVLLDFYQQLLNGNKNNGQSA
ncbi:hypothetical protein WR25_12598 [Diploscapter pachys]|uniref:Homeobox domain-containing protein n=1 Tax=Diploscapter pachys TaxID=2018661 RepID=A0A2A2KP00_9BILA|nr:hypothetical protein WR25_12598 [Diploscapter pachys]